LGDVFDMLEELHPEFVATICRPDVHPLDFGVRRQTQQANTPSCSAIDPQHKEVDAGIDELLDTKAVPVFGRIKRLEIRL
jgi:hypothetical protein